MSSEWLSTPQQLHLSSAPTSLRVSTSIARDCLCPHRTLWHHGETLVVGSHVILCGSLQSLKDGIVVHAMGADALPYLTTLGTLPASLALFNFYRLTLVRQMGGVVLVHCCSATSTYGCVFQA